MDSCSDREGIAIRVIVLSDTFFGKDLFLIWLVFTVLNPFCYPFCVHGIITCIANDFNSAWRAAAAKQVAHCGSAPFCEHKRGLVLIMDCTVALFRPWSAS